MQFFYFIEEDEIKNIEELNKGIEQFENGVSMCEGRVAGNPDRLSPVETRASGYGLG